MDVQLKETVTNVKYQMNEAYHNLTFLDEDRYVLSLLIQILQFLFLDGKSRFILVSAVDVSLQVYHTSQNVQSDSVKDALHFRQICMLLCWRLLYQIVLDILIQNAPFHKIILP